MTDDFLKNFKDDIKNIKEYINHIDLIDKIAKHSVNSNEEFLKNLNAHFQEFKTPKKVFEYKAIIISLYGILENTISKWIQEHVQNISLIIENYNNLEDNFKRNHFNLSIKLISLIIENRHSKFDNIDEKIVLKKLNQSISESNNFELNSEAFIPISGNLKHAKIVEAFKPLNINLDSLNEDLHREIIKIDDLVSHRNDIAHGAQVDNVLGITEFDDFILALDKYMTAVFNIICEKENEYYFKHKHDKFRFVDTPKEFYKQNTVCIINVKDIELKVDDILFIEKNKKFSKITIIDIQEDGKSVKSINNGEVGLKLDAPIKKNSKIWKEII